MKTTISTQAGAVEPLPAKMEDEPYTLGQIMANFEAMRETKDWAWCQRLAESVIERGIDAMPTNVAMAAVFSKNEKERLAKLLREREALLAVAEAANYAWALGQVVGESKLKLDTALANLVALRKAVQS